MNKKEGRRKRDFRHIKVVRQKKNFGTEKEHGMLSK